MRLILLAVALVIATSSCRSKQSSAESGPGVSAIAMGNGHGCALVSGGAIQCWGSNTYGALGNGTMVGSLVPVAVSNVTGATAIGAGSGITCALVTDGTVKCWGDNYLGLLGTGNTTDDVLSTPAQVSNLSEAASIGVGSGHACAIVAGGAVKCWGGNGEGQLGDGTNTNRTAPVSVRASSDPNAGWLAASAVAGGYAHTCAIVSGNVKCWGRNDTCQLGIDNGATSSSNVPVDVQNVAGVTAISAGELHNCALVNDGTVHCWGWNACRQLGTDAYVTANTVNLGAQAVAVAAGGCHSCAVTSGGTVKCWGDNARGQLGNGTTTDSTSPVDVTGLAGAVDVKASVDYTCALLTSGGVKCWGSNMSGQLGNPDVPSGDITTNSTVPVDVVF